MRSLINIADKLDILPRELGKLSGFFALPLIFIIMFDVITRKVDFFRLTLADYSMETGWSVPTLLQDSEWHIHGILMMLSFGFGYLMNAHVRVDIFREMASRRGQARIEFWGLTLLGLPYVMLMLYFSFEFVALSFSQGEGSESLTGIPMRYIIKSVLVIGFVLLLLAFTATWLRLCVFLYGKEELHDEMLDAISIFPEDASDALKEFEENDEEAGQRS